MYRYVNVAEPRFDNRTISSHERRIYDKEFDMCRGLGYLSSMKIASGVINIGGVFLCISHSDNGGDVSHINRYRYTPTRGE